jgi:hypothetical protein
MLAEEIEKTSAPSDRQTATASSHYEGKSENRELAADLSGRRQRRATWRPLGASRAVIIRWRRESGIDAGVVRAEHTIAVAVEPHHIPDRMPSWPSHP